MSAFGDYGLEVFEQGQEILGLTSFTVRLLDTLQLGAGTWGGSLWLASSKALQGMFAMVCPLTPGDAVPQELPGPGAFLQQYGTDLPACRVHNGAVELFPPMAGGTFSGNLVIYVFSYL